MFCHHGCAPQAMKDFPQNYRSQTYSQIVSTTWTLYTTNEPADTQRNTIILSQHNVVGSERHLDPALISTQRLVKLFDTVWNTWTLNLFRPSGFKSCWHCVKHLDPGLISTQRLEQLFDTVWNTWTVHVSRSRALKRCLTLCQTPAP